MTNSRAYGLEEAWIPCPIARWRCTAIERPAVAMGLVPYAWGTEGEYPLAAHRHHDPQVRCRRPLAGRERPSAGRLLGAVAESKEV